MKRYLLFLFSVLQLTTISAQDGTGQPVFLKEFQPNEHAHDFGRIYEKDGKVSTVFTFTNTGRQVVAISDVNTWCGCIVPAFTKKGVRPGETAHIKVEFDPDHKSGNFVKQVVVLLNNGKNYQRVWVKANIVPMPHPVTEDHPYYYGQGLYMSQQILPFPDLSPGQSHAYELKLANDTDKPMTIEFRRRPNNTVLKMPEKITLKARERTSIRVSYRYFRKHTVTRSIMVIPVVNGKEGKPLKVKWNAGDNKFRLLN
ncbi:DUF1573 domain-containing protein [Prevotella sp. KH2C16]|uniref:DUF1573 domain-containing protein n=1 Tax=Prevotella sp. KH2C16 TaxID=1855325 RepID=UPI0008E2A47D|nr:DUF1573 domain-containing protein [Prevotella sp. KH2C16]SFG02979.1 Protein of unknown function [Prevotella sp. KH2C16]